MPYEAAVVVILRALRAVISASSAAILSSFVISMGLWAVTGKQIDKLVSETPRGATCFGTSFSVRDSSQLSRFSMKDAVGRVNEST